jgi:hypothetical protein
LEEISHFQFLPTTKGSGKQDKLSLRERNRKRLLARQYPKITFRSIREEIGREDVSDKKVERSLQKHFNIKSHFHVKKPFVSERNKKRRLQFAKLHRNWTVKDWKSIVVR